MTSEYSTPEFRARFTEQARDAARRADVIIAVSRFTAAQVCSLLNVNASRIRVVPHGVDLDREVVDLAQRDRLILHVGAIQTRKNISRLVQAFEASSPGFRLVLAGGLGFGHEEIKQQISRSRRTQDIDLLGYVSPERLRELYRAAWCLAFPSLGEGFGIPVLEAMAAGLPVVTSNTTALAEIASDAAILVDPLDVNAIAQGMDMLCNNSVLWRELSVRGRQRASHFSWDAAVDLTWNAYSL